MTTLGLVFPGQGAQSVGMMSPWLACRDVLDTFEQASDVLHYDMLELVQTDPKQQLHQTEFTQVAMLTIGVGLARHLNAQGLQAQFMAGHSLGEYTALVAAQVLSLQDGLSLVAMRGRLMQAAVSGLDCAMVATIGLSLAQVEQLTEQASVMGLVAPANINGPAQIVVAGIRAAIDEFANLARAQGAKRIVPLNVSVPSHCPLMKEASVDLGQAFEALTWSLPKVPVVQNVDGLPQSTMIAIQSALIRQLYSPVQWVKTIEYLGQHCDVIVECGPSQVLTGLNKRITPIPCLTLQQALTEQALETSHVKP